MTRIIKETLRKTTFTLKSFSIEQLPKRIQRGSGIGIGALSLPPDEDLQNRPQIKWQDFPWRQSRCCFTCEVLQIEKPRDDNEAFCALETTALQVLCRSISPEGENGNEEEQISSWRNTAHSQPNFSQNAPFEPVFSQFSQDSQWLTLDMTEGPQNPCMKLVRGWLM